MSERESFAGAHEYDQVVDWSARLPREASFFRALFEEAEVSSVLDVGCGTGRHAAEFASWGLDVTAVDPDEGMLEAARRHARERSVDVAFAAAGYGVLSETVGGKAPFDAVVSLGNALQHVEGPEGAREAIEDIAEVTERGSVVALHFLNHDRLLAERPRLLSSALRETDEGERIFLKVLDFDVAGEDELRFELLTLAREDVGGWSVASWRASDHRVLPVGAVLDAFAAAGFRDVEAYGDHDRTPLDLMRHRSAVVVARR